MEQEENKSLRRKINTIWAIVILSVLILLLLSYIFSCKILNAEAIMKYVSAFATLLSILLSLFAIILTYTSIHDTNIQLHHIGVENAKTNQTLANMCNQNGFGGKEQHADSFSNVNTLS